MERRSFLKGLFAAGVIEPTLALPKEPPIMKIGILSDSQGYPYAEDWGFSNLERAFEGLAGIGVDVLVNAGDIADGPDFAPEALRYVQAMEKRVFGAAKPVDVACLGNHEMGFSYAKNRAKARENIRGFAEAYGHPDSQLVHKVVKGYDFITFTCYEDVGYDAEAIALLKGALDKAVARDAKKPIFVVTHFHPANTCLGGSSGRGFALRELFNGYPQIISLSGHSHSPLENERCIWQGEFTAIETGGLSYACLPIDYVNMCSCIVPWARESIGYQVAWVYADRIEIRRFHAEENRELKPGAVWKIDLPYRPEAAKYTLEKRRAAEVPPVFPKNARIKFRYDYGFCYFVIDPAKHPEFVDHYRLELTEIASDGESLAAPRSWNLLGDYYRYLHQRGRLCFKAPPKSLKGGVTYRVRMYPAAEFGTEGKPLEMTLVTRPGYPYRDDPVAYPQE